MTSDANGVPAGGQEANNAEDLYHQATALRAALSAPQQEAVVTDEMVEAYLGANKAYWFQYDKIEAPIGKWCAGTVADATRVSLLAALKLYTHPAPSVPEGDEENQAVRMFLMMYGGKACTIEQMRRHLECAGYAGCWPEWAANASGHLSKGGAQSWIRHMLSAAPKAPTTDDRKDADRGCAAFGCCSPTSDDPFENDTYEWAAENYGHDGCDGKIVPSHWMPLPPPPSNCEVSGLPLGKD